MLSAKDIIEKYISFFEKHGHVRIPNSSLVPENDPSTLFTSSGMQPLVPYLLGERHPLGVRLVNVQNSFRAQDIDEIGDNRHTTFFRMLGNWSLGDYFKTEEIPWLFEFLTDKKEGLGLDPHRLFVTVFKGFEDIPKDTESVEIWKQQFKQVGIEANIGERIFEYDAKKNWWSRSGSPENMPVGELGGPDTEVFYDFGPEHKIHENSSYKNELCHVNCDCGRYVEIGNSVFMQYKKTDNGFEELPQRNVDFGGGVERLIMALEGNDIFQSSLLKPVVEAIEKAVGKEYSSNTKSMRIVTDHMLAAIFISSNHVTPSNKEQGYILRRLIRRGHDHFSKVGGNDIIPVIDAIVEQYKVTDPDLVEKYEFIKNTILEEIDKYKKTQHEAKRFIEKKYKRTGDELLGVTEISADDAFLLYTTHGLSPTQIKSLGYVFDEQSFAQKMEDHQTMSRAGAQKKFAGGLADHEERTIMGHTATHLLHQALRDVLGDKVHQTGSNITTERIRFDFNFDRKLTDEEFKKVEDIVNKKILENLPVHYEIMTLDEARKLGAIGLFDDKYSEKVKIYFIGEGSKDDRGNAYSVEFCGGPHVEFTGKLKRFKINKEEGLGRGQRRIYSVVE